MHLQPPNPNPEQVERQKYLIERMRFMETVRNTRLLDVFVAEWHRLTKLHLPRKLKILQLVENLNKERIKKQLLEVIKGWWRVSAGPESGRCGGVVLGWGKGGGGIATSEQSMFKPKLTTIFK